MVSEESEMAGSVENPTEFVDYYYPVSGTMYSLRKGMVQINYMVKRYMLEGGFELVDMDITCDSEEEADKTANYWGEVVSKHHFHERLKNMEDNMREAIDGGIKERVMFIEKGSL